MFSLIFNMFCIKLNISKLFYVYKQTKYNQEQNNVFDVVSLISKYQILNIEGY